MRRHHVSVFVLLVAAIGSACNNPPGHLQLVDATDRPALPQRDTWGIHLDWSTAQPSVTVTLTDADHHATSVIGALNATGTAAILDGTRALADDWDPPYDGCYDNISNLCTSYGFVSDEGPQWADAIGGTPEGKALEDAVVQITVDATSCTPMYFVPDAPAPGC